jgi:hypothetical protein
MKLLILFILLAVVVVPSSAQTTHSYTAIPSTQYSVSTSDLQDVTKFDIFLKNNTGEEINISWKKISLELPADWDYSMCDLGTCYAGIPDGDHTMSPVEKDSSGFLAPNIYPQGHVGAGKIVIYVWDKDNPLINDTLTWFITATAQAGVQVTKNESHKFTIFPNPSKSRIKVDFTSLSSGKLNFIDMKGVSCLQIGVNDVKTIDTDLSLFHSGEYLVAFTSLDGSIFQRKFVKQ